MDDSPRRFLAQQSVAMLEQGCNLSKQCSSNIATLCCVKNRRCESSLVTSLLVSLRKRTAERRGRQKACV